jgi:hypothetical protein
MLRFPGGYSGDNLITDGIHGAPGGAWALLAVFKCLFSGFPHSSHTVCRSPVTFRVSRKRFLVTLTDVVIAEILTSGGIQVGRIL